MNFVTKVIRLRESAILANSSRSFMTCLRSTDVDFCASKYIFLLIFDILQSHNKEQLNAIPAIPLTPAFESGNVNTNVAKTGLTSDEVQHPNIYRLLVPLIVAKYVLASYHWSRSTL